MFKSFILLWSVWACPTDPARVRAPQPSYKELAAKVLGFSLSVDYSFSPKTLSSMVKLPSGDGDAVYQFVIKIATEVLVFIMDCRAWV